MVYRARVKERKELGWFESQVKDLVVRIVYDLKMLDSHEMVN